MAKKKCNDAPWLATFADLMSLLMAIFVLLFAMSTLDAHKYEAIVKSLTHTLGHGSDLTQTQVQYFKQADEQRKVEQDQDGETTIENLKPLYESLVETFAMASRQSDVQVSLDPEKKRVHISFPENISFPTGSAELKPGFAVYLSKLQPYVTEFSRVQAVGHTDKRPVVGGRFKSNWELSSARAAAVVQKLIENGIIQSRQAEVVGVADTSPLSLAETEAGYAMNRRVEIIIEPNYFEDEGQGENVRTQSISVEEMQIKK